jgi:hypothetical protein
LAPTLQPLAVTPVAAGPRTAASAVHNCGFPCAAPASSEPDGRLFTSPNHHALVAHGFPAAASDKVNVHLLGHPALHPSARAPFAVHLRRPATTKANGSRGNDGAEDASAGEAGESAWEDAVVSVVRRTSEGACLEAVDLRAHTLRSLPLAPPSPSGSSGGRSGGSKRSGDAAAVVDACAVGGSVATLAADGTVR